MALVYALQRVLLRGRLQNVLLTVAVCLLVGLAAGAFVALLKPLYAVAAVAGIAGGLLMLRSREFTFLVIVAVICLLPFGSVPLNVGFSPTFLNLALGVIFVIWAVRFATGRQEPWVTSPVSPWVLAFVLVTFGAFIAGLAHASLSTSSLRKFAEVPLGIAVFFAVLNHVRTRQALERLTLWLILGGTAAAAIGIVLYFMPEAWSVRLLSALSLFRYPSGPDVLRYIEDNPELALRAISTSVDPNVLGALLAVTMGLTAPHLFSPRPPLRRRWLFLCLAVSGICLLLTYSRSSLIALIVGLAFLGLLRYRRALLLIGAVGLFLLLLPQAQGYVAHFVDMIQGEDLATQMRFGEYKDALALIQRYPWLGVGFVDSPDIDLYLGVSSLYLLMAEEVGFIGLGVFAVCMVVFFGTLFVAWRQDGSAGPMAPWLLGPATAIITGLVHGLGDHTLLSFPHALTLFWLIIGLGAVAAHLAMRQDGTEDRPRMTPV